MRSITYAKMIPIYTIAITPTQITQTHLLAVLQHPPLVLPDQVQLVRLGLLVLSGRGLCMGGKGLVNEHEPLCV